MTTDRDDLRAKIWKLDLDDPQSAVPFSARLQRENRWNRSYTLRVIEEYRRFLWLTQVAGHMVSPSDAVDQVWHLHLTYTDSYWNELCGKILQRPLHHTPSRGGCEEAARYRDLYARTLDAYAHWLGEAPPDDIWPPIDEPHSASHDAVRVDRHCFWLLPKPRFLWNSARSGVRSRPFLAGCLLGATPSLAWVSNPLDWRGPDFLVGWLVLGAITLGLAVWVRQRLRRPLPAAETPPPALDLYDIAFLADGETRVLEAACSALVRMQLLEVQGRTLRATPDATPEALAGLHRIERSIVEQALAAPDGKLTIRSCRAKQRGEFERMAQRLTDLGLLESNTYRTNAGLASLLCMAPTLILGGLKIAVGLARERPVAFLVLGCIVASLTTMYLLFSHPRTTRFGARWLLRYRLARRQGKLPLPETTSSDTHADLAWSIALLGLASALPAGDPLIAALNPYRTNPNAGSGSGSSGCAGGCGGSGCGGGGCGGCGGCGG